jgi:hypothetical protein
MPKVEQNGMPTSLHYALTDSQCSKCGKQLEWSAIFDGINQPKYTSQHCNQDYAIHIDTVKVQMMTPRGGGRKAAKGSLEDEPRAIKMAKGLEEEHKQKKEETAPSMKPEERLDLEDYKSKDKESSSTSDTAKTTDFTSVNTIPTPEGDVQAETELKIPLEDNKENIKSEIKPLKVKTLSEEEPSFTTVSKEELSEKSSESATR